MTNEPKLFAVFDPDGKRVSGAVGEFHKDDAFAQAGFTTLKAMCVAMDAGYTCREVRIVQVEEPRMIPGTRITIGQMIAQIAEMGSVGLFAEQFDLDLSIVEECLLRLSDEVVK